MPSYWVYVMWHLLVGSVSLNVSITGNEYVRAYALCSKESTGNITLVVLNIGNATAEIALVGFLAEAKRDEYLFTSSSLSSSDIYLNQQLLQLEVKIHFVVDPAGGRKNS